MDKKIKKERKIINPIFTFILGIMLTAGTVYALSIAAADVSFIPSNNINKNNVQEAIEKVYADVITLDSIKQKTDKYNSFESTAYVLQSSGENGKISFNVVSTESVHDVSVAIVTGTNTFPTGTSFFDIKTYVSNDMYNLVKPNVNSIAYATLSDGTTSYYATAWIYLSNDSGGNYINFRFRPIKMTAINEENLVTNLENYANGERMYIKLDYVTSLN